MRRRYVRPSRGVTSPFVRFVVLVADPDVRGAVVGTALAFLGLDHREEIWAAGIKGWPLSRVVPSFGANLRPLFGS